MQICGTGICLFSRCVLEDLTLFYVIHVSGVDVEGYVFLVTEVAKDCLITGLRRIFTDSPHGAIGVTADKMIGVEFHSRRRDHVKEVLDVSFRLTYLYGYLLFLFCHYNLTPFFGFVRSTNRARNSDCLDLIIVYFRAVLLLQSLLVHIEVGFLSL